MTFNASALTANAFIETAESAARFWQIGLLWRLLATGHKTGGALCFVDEVNGAKRADRSRIPILRMRGSILLAEAGTFFAGDRPFWRNQVRSSRCRGIRSTLF